MPLRKPKVLMVDAMQRSYQGPYNASDVASTARSRTLLADACRDVRANES